VIQLSEYNCPVATIYHKHIIYTRMQLYYMQLHCEFWVRCSHAICHRTGTSTGICICRKCDNIQYMRNDLNVLTSTVLASKELDHWNVWVFCKCHSNHWGIYDIQLHISQI